MKISTKGRYALEALLDMALQDTAGYVALKGVGERRGLSENYLEQIFSDLRRSGLVQSLRGQQGGYRLARDPARITAGEILRAVEGPLVPVACVSNAPGSGSSAGAARNRKACCPRIDRCVTRGVWIRVTDAMERATDGVTLADLLAETRAHLAAGSEGASI